MHVLDLTRYGRLGASSRTRLYQYVPFLQANDITITVEPLLSNAYLSDLYGGRIRHPSLILSAYTKRMRDLRSAVKYDLVWVEKEMFPWLPTTGLLVAAFLIEPIARLCWALKRGGGREIIETVIGTSRLLVWVRMYPFQRTKNHTVGPH